MGQHCPGSVPLLSATLRSRQREDKWPLPLPLPRRHRQTATEGGPEPRARERRRTVGGAGECIDYGRAVLELREVMQATAFRLGEGAHVRFDKGVGGVLRHELRGVGAYCLVRLLDPALEEVALRAELPLVIG